LYLANRIAKDLRDSIYNELKYRASAGISFNKTCAKIASSQNKPNAQTLVPIRYMKRALAPIEIYKIRFCGGKISEALFESKGIKTMGQIQNLDASDLTDILNNDHDKAIWLKKLALGICNEVVAQKGPPNSASGIKTFRRISYFN